MIQPVDECATERNSDPMVSQYLERSRKAAGFSSALSCSASFFYVALFFHVAMFFRVAALLRVARPFRIAALLVMLSGTLGSLLWTEPAQAYAWMIRHDYSACSTCHADPSGGELLTQYGRVTSDLVLRTHYGEGDKSDDPDTGVLWGAIDLPDSLLLSGSFRNLSIIRPGADKVFTYVPVMQGDLYGQLRLGPVTFGGSVGIAKVPYGSQNARAAQVTTNQGDGMNMISRSHYVGVDLGTEFVLRAGRLNLPFGVRIPEHTAWVRDATRTDRESDQQTGLALAYVGENFRAEVMGIAGNYQTKLRPVGQYADFSSDAVRERGYSMYLEGLGSTRFAAGISSKVTYAKLDRVSFEEDSLRQAHGLTMRWAPFTALSFLGEADALFRSNANPGYVGFLQGDVEPIQGLHFMLTGEVVDHGLAIQGANDEPPEVRPGYGAPKFGGWLSVDWFFWKQLELRVDMIVREKEPFTILSQLHFYL